MDTNNITTDTKELEYSSKEIISDIISIRKFLPGFLNLNKDYKDLVEFFLQFDLNDKNTPYPSAKILQEKLGINYGTLKRKLLQFREDIINHEGFGINFSINKVEYEFIFENSDKVEFLLINDLPIVPRVGEQVIIPFFKATVGTDCFHVRKIDHYIDETKQSIRITLKAGEYNLFWHLKKDEEYEKGNISIHEYIANNEFLLKHRFGFR